MKDLSFKIVGDCSVQKILLLPGKNDELFNLEDAQKMRE